jgi:hypothetical protein
MVTSLIFKQAIRLVHWPLALAVALAGSVVAINPAVSAPPDVQSIVGQWNLNLDSTNRTCRVTLRTDSVGANYAIGMPAGCRHAMPILAPTAAWSKDASGVTLRDPSGNAILQFSTRDDGVLIADGSEGQSYSLVAVDGRKMRMEVATASAPNPPQGTITGGAPKSPVALSTQSVPPSGAASLQQPALPKPNPPAPAAAQPATAQPASAQPEAAKPEAAKADAAKLPETAKLLAVATPAPAASNRLPATSATPTKQPNAATAEPNDRQAQAPSPTGSATLKSVPSSAAAAPPIRRVDAAPAPEVAAPAPVKQPIALAPSVAAPVKQPEPITSRSPPPAMPIKQADPSASVAVTPVKQPSQANLSAIKQPDPVAPATSLAPPIKRVEATPVAPAPVKQADLGLAPTIVPTTKRPDPSPAPSIGAAAQAPIRTVKPANPLPVIAVAVSNKPAATIVASAQPPSADSIAANSADQIASVQTPVRQVGPTGVKAAPPRPASSTPTEPTPMAPNWTGSIQAPVQRSIKIAPWSEVAKVVATPDLMTSWLEATDLDVGGDVPLAPSAGPAGAPMQIVHVGPVSTKPGGPITASQGAPFDPGPNNDLTAAVTSAQIAQVSGRYAIWRGRGTGTGCILNLDGKARGPMGNFRATLSPACRDQGVEILDPTGWTIEHGRLLLSTRNGTANFDRRADGTWAKEGGDSEGLVLTKD